MSSRKGHDRAFNTANESLTLFVLTHTKINPQRNISTHFPPRCQTEIEQKNRAILGTMDGMEKRPMTTREEANALTCIAFRNSSLENLHAGKYSEVLENPKLSRISDVEMKALMIETSAKVAELLTFKKNDPVKYWRQLIYFHENFCGHWEK
jgi:hypothetical protein